MFTKITNIEPQAVYAAFVSGINISSLITCEDKGPQLADVWENFVRDNLRRGNSSSPGQNFVTFPRRIFSPIRYICSPSERSVIALPTNHGDLDIPILIGLASQEYNNFFFCSKHKFTKIK